jgi:uncharacterized protein (TIGR02391 family)
MATFASTISDPEDLLALEPEELAELLLRYLFDGFKDNENGLSRHNFFVTPEVVQGYPPEYHERVRRALMESWMWLEREGLIAPRPGETGDWRFITRRGRRLAASADLKAYHHANLLPKTILHPVIAQRVYPAFLRGDYETAIFQVFKEVEVAVRKAGGFDPTALGTDLMRDAFDTTRGPLTDLKSPKAEREALAHLFAGAIGLYKNPASHRRVSISEPAEVVEIISLASHLLRIIDSRTNDISK